MFGLPQGSLPAYSVLLGNWVIFQQQSIADTLYSSSNLISCAFLPCASTFILPQFILCPCHAKPSERSNLVIKSPTPNSLLGWRSLARPSLRLLASLQTWPFPDLCELRKLINL